ncbi:Arm DNA-binding domain-containing protein [Pelistega ratti]|uniref:Arm DNA-binding domain-containing protein n=1 Tax=Pelistega ratti TaxID=2652177 RepID=UPI003C6DFC87
MALTDKQIKALQGTGKPQKILDRDNLYIRINAKGTVKSFLYRYRRPTDNKEDTYTI